MTRKRTTTSRKTTSKRPTRRKSPARRSSSSSKKPRFTLSLNLQQKAIIFGIFFIFLTAIIVLSLLSPSQGELTTLLSDGMWRLFGWGGAIIPIALGLSGFYLVLWGMEQAPGLPSLRLLGFILLFLAFEAFATLTVIALNNGLNEVSEVARESQGGGYLGGLIAWALTQGVGRFGAVFILLVLGIIAAVLASGISRQDMGVFFQSIFKRRGEPTTEEIPINNSRSRVSNRQPRLIDDDEATSPASTSTETVPEPATAAVAIARPRRQSRGKRNSQPAADIEKQATATPTPVFFNLGSDQSWTLPNIEDLLESGSEQELGDTQIREQVEIIEHTLESFGAPATVVEINQGPTITQYGVEPKFIVQRSGKRTKVKVGKIASLSDDLALALAARSIRVQAPVPGKGYVGIEVPNSSKALVSLRDVMEAAEFQAIHSSLRIGLGQNVAGQPIATDLTQMPHLLIAGTTGSGKSVCVNTIVACLLLQNTPATLKLVMVDPKRVELTGYNGVPHLVAPVVVDLERVTGTLQWAMREMDNRYKRLAEVGTRNISEFNKKAASKGEEAMPYIVIVIDELADLMMLSPEETERGITRLAQLARATGIHMVIATQRPSVDVVTGLIKANFPARIAFAVASSTDSRVILDTTGAERLLGQGDMLFQSPDAAAPIRMQGCFVGPKELDGIIAYWQGARRAAISPAQPSTMSEESSEHPGSEVELPEEQQPPLWEEMREIEAEAEKYSDELLPEAIATVRQLDKASTSLLQRRFRIGYTRAARLIDTMEEDGIIGPPTGTSKARIVLPYTKESELEEFGGQQD